MDLLQHIEEKMIRFRDERDWKQFHNPKDLALSLSLEAAELLEIFQWQPQEKLEGLVMDKRDEIGDELVDILIYILYLSHDLEIDLSKAFERKYEQNAKKYSVNKAYGSSKKYSEL